jgi:hypothetical protein
MERKESKGQRDHQELSSVNRVGGGWMERKESKGLRDHRELFSVNCVGRRLSGTAAVRRGKNKTIFIFILIYYNSIKLYSVIYL